MFDLSGKTAVVTGAGQGIGAGVARVLASAGAHVYVNDLHADRAQASAHRCGSTAHPLPFDVTDRAAVEKAFTSVGQVDILVNNAGIPPSMRMVPFKDMPADEWAPYIDVNLYGVLHCTKAVIGGMCDRGWGRVITISSGAGTQGLGIGVSLYAAGKGAGISFMRHLSTECARFGVTANTLALGLIERATQEDERNRSDTTRSMAKGIPAGRMGQPEDVGYACAFLASNEAAWITGQTIGVNGGASTT